VTFVKYYIGRRQGGSPYNNDAAKFLRLGVTWFNPPLKRRQARCLALPPLDLTLAEKDAGRVEQVKSMMDERSFDEVGRFCAYHRQTRLLNLPVRADPRRS
jgi:hypothetical protein